jgi:vanillate O-demethylase monooxygenase subunit
MAAFREDVEALTRLEEILADGDPERYEMSIASDAPAVAMRRYLLKRATIREDAQVSMRP